MAKKFGKRGKPRGQQPPEDPRNMFGPPQLQRPSGPPASSTPLADYLGRGWPGVDAGYVVLPRSLAESMSLPWQQHLVHLLAQFHEAHGRLQWPVYRVVPSRYERLVDLDEEQLAEAGYLVEIDVGGEMVYRERSGRKVEDPENTTVLVSCLDPIVPPTARQQARPDAPARPPDPTGPQSGPIPAQGPQPQQPQQQPPRRTPAPMNIGPQPVWPTTRGTSPPQKQEQPPQPPPAPQRSAQPPQPGQSQQSAQQPASPPAQSSSPPAQPSPSSPSPQASTPPPAPPTSAAPPPSSSAQQAEPDQERKEADTPPRGLARPGADARGWFDELHDSGDTSGEQANPETGQFGPTGDPTEVPYRYRR